jgi:hypothetical protein
MTVSAVFLSPPLLFRCITWPTREHLAATRDNRCETWFVSVPELHSARNMQATVGHVARQS